MTTCSRRRKTNAGGRKLLGVEGDGYWFDLSKDERERANQAAIAPERLSAMRAAWERWNAGMPAIPQDDTVSLGYSTRDMPPRCRRSLGTAAKRWLRWAAPGGT